MKNRGGIALGLVVLVAIVGLVGVEGWTGVDTEAQTQGMVCNSTSHSAQWVNVSKEGGVLIQTPKEWVYNSSGQVPNGNCTLHAEFSEVDYCCPSGYSCNQTTGICSKIPQDYCGNYKTSPSCLGSNQDEWNLKTPAYNFFRDNQNTQFVGNTNVSVYEGKCRALEDGNPYPLNGGPCQNYSLCVCAWENNTCSSSRKEGILCEDGRRIDRIQCITELQGQPNNLCDTIGKIIQNYTAIAINLSATDSSKRILLNPALYGCTANQIQHDCGAVIVVPFFTFANLLVSILGIGVVYFFFHKKIL
jgi:hypothetical protein